MMSAVYKNKFLLLLSCRMNLIASDILIVVTYMFIVIQLKIKCWRFTPRRAVLYVPGNDERKLQKIPGLQLDCAVMDCEDGVAANRKVDIHFSAGSALRQGHNSSFMYLVSTLQLLVDLYLWNSVITLSDVIPPQHTHPRLHNSADCEPSIM